MDDRRFDELAKALGRGTSRRAVLKGLVGTAVGGIAGVSGLSAAGAEARCKVQGRPCGKDGNCCSGLCCNKVCCAAGDICDGNGFCRPAGTCAAAVDCPPSAVPCQVAACINGQCGFLNSQAGTPCLTPSGAAGICQAGSCVATVSCSDGIKNGDETDVDCGGSCPNKCSDLQGCLSGADCQSGFCCNGICRTVTAEICNGLDDNCNGQVDEGFGTLTCGVGACQRTVQACVNGVPQVCTPGTPSPEICGNGIDDDCDGVVDNGCCDNCDDGNPCTDDACLDGACSHAPVPVGTLCPGGVCDGSGNCVECFAASECPQPADPACQTATCVNGVCGFVNAPVNTVCTQSTCAGNVFTSAGTCDGAGTCRPGASVTCDDGNPCTSNVCNPGTGCAFPPVLNGAPCGANQFCINGLCSGACAPGSIRSCYSGPAGTAGVGICHAGTQFCDPTGHFGPCQGEVTPQTEVCDGLDNNCNGVVDDNPLGEGQGCVTPSCPSGGQFVCAGGALVCSC